jgi:hypothetical protein
MRYMLGEKYINAIGNLAKSDNAKTVLIPADIQDTLRGILGSRKQASTASRALVRLIGIETATRHLSVALWQDGEIIERSEDLANGGSERLLPWVHASCWRKASMDAGPT